MLRRSETSPRRLVSSRLVLDRRMKIVYEPLLEGREATVVNAVPVSWQQTSSGQLQWSRWIEMWLKFFIVDQRLEILLVPLVMILAREVLLKFLEVDQHLEMLRVPLFTILAREMRWTFWGRPSFGDIASAASHDIGARIAIENFLKLLKLWRCCECR